jgi:hypothetical protein
MSASDLPPLDTRTGALAPSEAERSLLYSELIGLAGEIAPMRGGAARRAHAQLPGNNPGINA